MKLLNYVIKLAGRETFMYLLFGVLTTIVNFFVYYICNILIGFNAGISTTIAFIVSVAFAYVTNKKWVFDSDTNNFKEVFMEIIKFIGARLVTYFFDLFMMILLVDKYQYNSLICKAILSIVIIILNYVFSKLIVFNNKKNN